MPYNLDRLLAAIGILGYLVTLWWIVISHFVRVHSML